MAINYPTSLDNFTNPTGTDPLTSPSHAGQHADINDAVEALQAKVGVDNSTVATSLEARVNNLIGLILALA
jgi:hypothetical protein